MLRFLIRHDLRVYEGKLRAGCTHFSEFLVPFLPRYAHLDGALHFARRDDDADIVARYEFTDYGHYRLRHCAVCGVGEGEQAFTEAQWRAGAPQRGRSWSITVRQQVNRFPA